MDVLSFGIEGGVQESFWYKYSCRIFLFQNHPPLPHRVEWSTSKSNQYGNHLMKKKRTLNEHTGTLSFLRVAATTSPNEPAPRSLPISKLAKSAEIYKKEVINKNKVLLRLRVPDLSSLIRPRTGRISAISHMRFGPNSLCSVRNVNPWCKYSLNTALTFVSKSKIKTACEPCGQRGGG